jgi:hypothetical protein
MLIEFGLLKNGYHWQNLIYTGSYNNHFTAFLLQCSSTPEFEKSEKGLASALN